MGTLDLLRDENCSLCRLSDHTPAGRVCLISGGPVQADLLIVSGMPMSQRQKDELAVFLKEAELHTSSVAYASAIKCRTEWGAPDAGKKDLKACAPYLEQEIAAIKPKAVLILGNEALYSLLGKSGILKYRAKTFNHDSGAIIFPTISPSMVKRNPGQRAGFIADLQFLRRLLVGEDAPVGPPTSIRYVTSKEGLSSLAEALQAAQAVSFDVETTGFNEFEPDSRIVTLSLTLCDNEKPVSCWVIPLYHPESPFKSNWTNVVRWLRQHVRRKKLIGHNGKFDLRWLRRFGWAGVGLTFDTMLAAHLLNENRPKSLKPLAQSLLGVAPWAISTKDLLETPLKTIVKYNGLDTWYTAHLYFLFRKQLLAQPRLARLFKEMLVPASNEFVDIESVGIWTDRELLMTRKKVAEDTLEEIDGKLVALSPAREVWPANVKEANFNPSNFSRWLLFDHLKLPVLARGKTKEDGSPGNPSMAEAVMLRYAQMFPENDILKGMNERTKWQKYTSSFFSPYAELIDDLDRIHTTFKLTGTVTGRLSSGKGDEEKVTARVQNRGVNLQQVPRDQFVRGIFGAPPGWVFIECDYSQVELRVAAFMAQEKTMLALYNSGQDIHTTMAQRMTGKTEPTKEERKKAKAVNFGFLYGMQWKKFIETAWSNYGVEVTENEAKAFRRAFFDEFPLLQHWHEKQRRLARTYKRVESPLGRVRHLPDIDSEEQGVRAEAERQAINSPVQSFASDMTVMSLVALSGSFREAGLRTRSVGTVHDAINFEAPISEVDRVVPMIRHQMENLPLHRFGIQLNIPIVADVKIGTRWGDAVEVENDISCDRDRMREWMKEHYGAV